MLRIFLFIGLIISFKPLKSQSPNENILVEFIGNSPREILNSDIDNDGDLDMIYTNHLGVVWLENNGNNEFLDEQLLFDVFAVTSISVSDMDNDSKLDLIVGTYFGITLLSNLENNVFSDTIELHNFNLNPFIPANNYGFYKIITKDVDNDGNIDLIYNDHIGKRMVWQKNLENNSFSSQKIISIELTRNWRIPFEVIDIDNDGYLDIILHNDIERSISWYRNISGEFSTEEFEIHSDVEVWRNLNVKDIDSDGDLDVLVWDIGQSDFDWYVNDGFMNFQKQALIPNIKYFRIVHVDDIDDDADSDIFYIHIDSENGTKNIVWLENINGEFSKEPCARVISPLGQSTVEVHSIHSYDANFDGKKDIILTLEGRSLEHKIIYVDKFTCISETTSNSNLNFEELVMSYPNPFENYIVFESKLNLKNNFIISIFDATGMKLKTEILKSKNQVLNTFDYSKGIYFYQITDEIGNIITNGKLIRK